VFDNPETIFRVVVNDEEQYSIWPAGKEIPLGWREVGVTGKKQECLDYITTVWTDMRPLSLRRAMQAQSRAAQAHSPHPSLPRGRGSMEN
jgi:MbtH protein